MIKICFQNHRKKSAIKDLCVFKKVSLFSLTILLFETHVINELKIFEFQFFYFINFMFFCLFEGNMFFKK